MIIVLEQLNLSLNALQFLKTNNYEQTENIAALRTVICTCSLLILLKKNVFVYEKFSSGYFHCPVKSYVFMLYFFTNTKKVFHSFYTYSLFKIKIK